MQERGSRPGVVEARRKLSGGHYSSSASSSSTAAAAAAATTTARNAPAMSSGQGRPSTAQCSTTAAAAAAAPAAQPHRCRRHHHRCLLPPWLLPPLALLLLLAAARPSVSDQVHVPWCTVLPPVWKAVGGASNKAHIHTDLQAAALANNLTLIPFPEPSNPLAWPDADILRTCKYIAYAPGVIDGLGSQYTRILFVMAWAHINNASFIHLVPEYMDHGTNITAADRFFNLGHGQLVPSQVPRGSTVCLAEHCGPDANAMIAAYRPTLLRKMAEGDQPRLAPLRGFNFRNIIVSVHIRRGDVQFRAMDINNHRWTPDSFYVEVIRNVTQDLRTLPDVGYEVHMYSQGNLSNFANISGPLAGEPLMWHLDEDEVSTLRGFMCADVFIKGSSGLSGIGEWYSQGVLVRTGGKGWRADVNPHKRYWDLTRKELLARVNGRRFMHAGC